MNTPAKLPFAISAKFLGPIFSLDSELTKSAQNLIYARNGTGKSFLARALRYLDFHCQGRSIDDAARNLISDESPDGSGYFCLNRGIDVIGELHLKKTDDLVSAQVPSAIFHVFSGDFVQDELREREYNLDGEIENQIAVDSANIRLTDAQEALNRALLDEDAAADALRESFNSERETELIGKAGIRKQLREFKALSYDVILEKFPKKPISPDQTFGNILRDLDHLKAIPSEPNYPRDVEILSMDAIQFDVLATSLLRITSPSSVAKEIKRKIEAHHDFYKAGIGIVRDESRDTCPFCEQGITSSGPSAVIGAYVDYFADEEEKHKSELRSFWKNLKHTEDTLTQIGVKLAHQKSEYDSLKSHLPSKRKTELSDTDTPLNLAHDAIAAIRHVIEQKAGDLTTSRSLPKEDLISRMLDLNKIVEDNNVEVANLNKAIKKSDDERRALQRNACSVFELEFVIQKWSEIEAIHVHREAIHVKKDELTTLEKSSPSTDARSRVASTFELLLQDFFSSKYVFDKDRFVLKRGDHEMSRGAHRTLSDGEKTTIAFCYFIACVHRKVTSNSDYKKLVLVFDDPVTSMSYEFVFAIAQTLKNLNFSSRGEISVNPSLIDGNKHWRPELLILTHSSYFFNISLTNRVVESNSAFTLTSEKDQHKIARLSKYIAPFQAQLKDIYNIANGSNPDHATANAVRSVLEAVGRFCRPDKSNSLTEFVQHLAGEEKINVKSILINSLCHGTYYEETLPPDDLRLACKETLLVVERYAYGQLEILKIAN